MASSGSLGKRRESQVHRTKETSGLGHVCLVALVGSVCPRAYVLASLTAYCWRGFGLILLSHGVRLARLACCYQTDSPSIWGKNVVRMGVGNSGSERHSSLAGGNATSPWLCHSSSPGITNGFIFFLTPFRLPFDCLLCCFQGLWSLAGKSREK